MKTGKGQGPKNQYWNQERAIDAKENRNCGQCDFNFQTIQEIMFHVRNTEGHTPYCAHCDSKFSNYRNYGSHVKKFHLENTIITCEDCGKISKTKERHLLHWNYAHKVEDSSYCDYCGLKGLNKSKTRQHMIYCKKYHPALAIAEGLAKNAETEEIIEWCENLTFEHYVEWKERVYDEILEYLLQGKDEKQLDPVEVGNRARIYLDSIYSNKDSLMEIECENLVDNNTTQETVAEKIKETDRIRLGGSV